MLNKNYLEKLATKTQTNYKNVVREYIQNLFLRSFYTKENSENFLFKGGTALRIVFKSPRFSEDLDFTGFKNGKVYEKVLEQVLYDMESEGMGVEIKESKATSGGFLANININYGNEKIEIKNQISFRDSSVKNSENIIISSDFAPTYNLFLLDRKILIAEKIKALIERNKPRDFFDLHYIFTNPDLRKEIYIDEMQREKILIKVNQEDKRLLESELKILLPNSFWRLINDLPGVLRKDLI